MCGQCFSRQRERTGVMDIGLKSLGCVGLVTFDVTFLPGYTYGRHITPLYFLNILRCGTAQDWI